MGEWLQIAMRRDIVVRSLKVAIIVGSILALINQGDALLQGNVSMAIIGKILLTYCVPFCVSTYASVSAVQAQQNTR